jgi:hypothetical protein
MSHQYLTRTVRMPVRASGTSILDRENVTVGFGATSSIAATMADLINLAKPAAEALDDAYDHDERAKWALLATEKGTSE